MGATTGDEDRAGTEPELLAVAVRRRAAPPPSLESIGRLLRGRPAREEAPEQAALDEAVERLLARARAAGASGVDQVSLSIAIEGQGSRRTVTVALVGRPVHAR